MPLVSKDPCVGFAFCQQQFFSVRFSKSQDCIGLLERKVVREACACVNPLFKNKKGFFVFFLEWLDCGLPSVCRTDSTSASCVPAAAPAVPVTGGTGTSTWVLRY